MVKYLQRILFWSKIIVRKNMGGLGVECFRISSKWDWPFENVKESHRNAPWVKHRIVFVASNLESLL